MPSSNYPWIRRQVTRLLCCFWVRPASPDTEEEVVQLRLDEVPFVETVVVPVEPHTLHDVPL